MTALVLLISGCHALGVDSIANDPIRDFAVLHDAGSGNGGIQRIPATRPYKMASRPLDIIKTKPRVPT